MKYFVSFCCAAVNSLSLNEHDVMSDIALSFPTMFMGVRAEALRLCFLSTNNQSSCDAGIDAEVLPLYSHDTADVLSQKNTVYLYFKSRTKYSSTSHTKTSPANPRLLMVNFPFYFPSDTSSFWISVGNVNYHTHGCTLCNPDLITPPDNSLKASVYYK